MDTEKDQAQPALSVHAVIARIKDGSMDPAALPKESRQACVEALLGEGYAVTTIAQLLQRSDRTVKRDIDEIMKRNSLSPSLELAKELIGEMSWRAHLHHAHLMRIARSKEATPGEKIQAEYSAWRVQRELIERFQALGYLPSRPAEPVWVVSGTGMPEMGVDEAKQALDRLEQVQRETGIEDETWKRQIEAVRARIGQAEIARDVAALESSASPTKETKEESSE